jgi:NadR type nicotinamide-nucleotide adenylyltransferase
MMKVAILGPESSGKTTLVMQLGQRFNAVVVPEFARELLHARGPAYVEEDLLVMAKGQLAAEDAAARDLPDLLICDTELITIRIWSEVKYGRCHPWIEQQTMDRDYDLFLLCKPDLAWEADPLRENPRDRDRLFDRYVDMLTRLEKPYAVIFGTGQARTDRAMARVAALLDGPQRSGSI